MAAPITISGAAWTQIGTGMVTLQCDSAQGVFVEAATTQPASGSIYGVRIDHNNAGIPNTIVADTANQPIWARVIDPNIPVNLLLFGAAGILAGLTNVDYSVAGDSEYAILFPGMI